MNTVLVVDDDPSVLRIAAKVLRQVGYSVVEAASGTEALHVIGEVGGRIDLPLTDVTMPRMNGRERSDALLARYPHVRVLFMSGYTDDEVFLERLHVAEANCIRKPFTVFPEDIR